MSPSIWGPNARTFDPSRWLDAKTDSDPTSTGIPNEGPGVWPNMMTFIDGARRCVGYKLALMECKILLFTLVRNFVFAPVEGKTIAKWNL